jgi:murein hydrolase activator
MNRAEAKPAPQPSVEVFFAIKVFYRRAFSHGFAPKVPWILGFSFLMIAGGALAQRTSVDAEKQQLKEFRERIEQLQRDVTKSEESRSEAVDNLRSSEKAISEANRNLAALNARQGEIAASLADVQQKIDAGKRDIAKQQNLLERMLRHHHRHGNTDALRLALEGRDVAEVERQLQYFGYISKSRAGVIASLKQMLTNLAELEAGARVKKEELAANAVEQQRTRAALETERSARQKTLARISGDIARSRSEIGKLKRDEDRLTKLVDQITRALARQAEERRAAQRRAAEKAAAKAAEKATDRTTEKSADRGGAEARIRQPAEVVEKIADAAFVGRAFGSLRGQLKLPVRGELIGRFGAPREERNVTWKGVFIRADVGQQVRAVADGRVTYADWLRGYGNLMIIDHGDGYMSLYGHNESLLKNVGENISSGESIASVGSTGGALDSGVYFELRHEGKPIDPVRWIAR